MNRGWLVAAAAASAVASLGTLPNAAHGCPKCRLGAAAVTGASDAGTPRHPEEPAGGADAADEFEVEGAGTGSARRDPRRPYLSLTGGVTFPTAYYHRGYLQEDQGFIAQPFLTLSVPIPVGDDSTLTPYVSTWNSFHENQTFGDGDNGVWYESELMAGVVASRGPLSLELKYTLFSYPNGALSQIEDVGAKLSYDLATLWQREEDDRGFVLLGWLLVEKEISDRNGPPVASEAAASAVESALPRHAPIFHLPPAESGEPADASDGFDTSGQGTYIELGVEPSARVNLGNVRLGASTPLVLGMGAGDYYQRAGGDNETLGYFSGGLQVTVPLSDEGDKGQWYLTGSVTYLNLMAESARFANGGDRHEVIGAVGLSFAF